MAKPNAEITDLTVCRAIFALWVFVYHIDLYVQFARYLGPAAGLIQHGYLGVDGFFILSGLILAKVYPEFSETLDGTVRFWGKRLVRIYPVHLAALVILGVIFAIGTAYGIAPRDPARFGLWPLLQNILLIQGWGFDNHLAWNYPSWAVSAEWAGYLLLPFFIWAIWSWSTLVAGELIILTIPTFGLIVHFSAYGMNVTEGAALVRFFSDFILGILTARLVPSFADTMPSRVLAAIGVGMVLVALVIPYDPLAIYGLWLLLAAIVMQNFAEWPPIFGKARPLRALGYLSYSFYMSFGVTELLVTQAFRHLNLSFTANGWLYAAAMTVLTLVLAIILYFGVEVPCRRLGDRWLAKPDPDAAAGKTQIGSIHPPLIDESGRALAVTPKRS